MATPPFPNIYNLRRVGENAGKSCDICYKITSSVLITPDQKDFFYICPSHLKDNYFCTSKLDPDAAKVKRDKEIAAETERLKKEYEEKQKRKKEKEDKEKEEKEKKDKEKSGMFYNGLKAVGSGVAWGAKAVWEGTGEEKKEGEGENASSSTTAGSASKTDDVDSPKVFELKSSFYAQRIQKKKQAEVSKRDRERVVQPGYFPSVPSHNPGE